MKLVSTTAPASVAAASIRDAYRGLVRTELLEEWAAAPAKAPGRHVSSPWPDRIDVESTSITGGQATVKGTFVEVTSTGDARRIPVQLQLMFSDGTWLITACRPSEPESDERA